MSAPSDSSKASAGAGTAPEALPDTFDERRYLALIDRVIRHGTREDSERTGVGTLKISGAQLRFSLAHGGRDSVPAITCRRLFLRGVGEELLWFLRGSTDATELAAKKVNIWEGNSSAEFLAERGLRYLPGQIGPGYGHQWRQAGAPYGIHPEVARARGLGRDQLAEAFRLLRDDPASRRIIVNAWSVKDLDAMALPPCHYAFQFVTRVASAACDPSDPSARSAVKRALDCIVTMRSGDLGLGIPFNAVSYALLTHLASIWADLLPGELIINIADAHVYSNHVDQLRGLTPVAPPPSLKIDERVKDLAKKDPAEFLDAVGALSAEEAFTYVDYQPGPPVKMEMAV
jgi:thymidylate synthase